MVATTLDYFTVGVYCFVFAVCIWVFLLSFRRNKHNSGLRDVDTLIPLFIIFVLTLLVSGIHLSASYTLRMELFAAEVHHHSGLPHIFVAYPRFAQRGERVELVLTVNNDLNDPLDLNTFLADHVTGRIMDAATPRVDPQGVGVRRFSVTMSEEDLEMRVGAKFLFSFETTVEPQASITIENVGIGVSGLLLMGVLVAAPILAYVVYGHLENSGSLRRAA